MDLIHTKDRWHEAFTEPTSKIHRLALIKYTVVAVKLLPLFLSKFYSNQHFFKIFPKLGPIDQLMQFDGIMEIWNEETGAMETGRSRVRNFQNFQNILNNFKTFKKMIKIVSFNDCYFELWDAVCIIKQWQNSIHMLRLWNHSMTIKLNLLSSKTLVIFHLGNVSTSSIEYMVYKQYIFGTF